MDLEKLVLQLEVKLAGKLPGVDAQLLMMPAESTRARFDLTKKDVKRGGVLILFYKKEDEIYIPLTQRHDYGGSHGGQVSLPGGKIEDQDTTIVDTALRETFEEIGVVQDDIQVIGTLTDLYIPPSNFRVTPVVGYVNKPPVFELDAFEVKELIEAPLGDLLNAEKRKKKAITVNSSFKINAPYFDVKGRVVWGATAMILSELHELIVSIQSKP